MRAAVYTRVSTDDQASRQLPLEGQRAACLELIHARGWLPAGEYADPGISGTYGPDKRPGLAALLEAARRGLLDTVVTWDDSRLARDDTLHGWIRWELRGVQIVTVTSPGASALETGLRAIVAAEQARQGRLATSRGVRANMRRGGRHGSDALGYQWIDGLRVIEPTGAAIIRDMFVRALRGDSIGSIRRAYPQWSGNALRHRLRSPTYAGGRVIGRRLGGVGRRVPVPRDHWEIVWDMHEAIINRADWDRVQEILDGHKQRPYDGRIALSGLLWCEPCGAPMPLKQWRDLKGGGRRFWYRCSSCGVRVGLLHETGRIVRHVAGELAAPDLAERIAAALQAAYSAGEDAGAAKAEIRRLSRARDALVELIASGTVTDTHALGERLQQTQQEISRAEEQLRAAKRAKIIPTAEEIRAHLLRIGAKAEALADHPQIDYAARPLLHRTLERIDVSEEAFALRPGEIVGSLGPLASLGFTWRMERRAA